MKSRIWGLAIVAIALGLAACGGGGGGGGTLPVALPSTSPQSAPSPFVYKGTKTVTYSYGFGFGYPTPSPQPTGTFTYAVADTVSIGRSPAPGGVQATDVHVAEAVSGQLSMTQNVTDAWVSTSNTQEALVATTQQEPSSATAPLVTTVYGTPQVLDELPETNGASWSNGPAATITYLYADGDSGKRVIASNGTYTDTETTGGQQAQIVENADGSGQLTGPYYGGNIISSIQFSAPASSGGGAAQITITVNYTTSAQLQFGLPPSQTITDGAWYAFQPSPVFYSESDQVTTNVPLPAQCTPNSYGNTANEVTRTITTLDTIVGYEEQTILESFDIGGTPICEVLSDIQNYAYDQQGNTPYLILTGPLGLEVITTNESLVLQPGAQGQLPVTMSSGRSSRSSLSAGMALATQATAAALQAHFLDTAARTRIEAERALLRQLHDTAFPPEGGRQ